MAKKKEVKKKIKKIVLKERKGYWYVSGNYRRWKTPEFYEEEE